MAFFIGVVPFILWSKGAFHRDSFLHLAMFVLGFPGAFLCAVFGGGFHLGFSGLCAGTANLVLYASFFYAAAKLARRWSAQR